MCCHTENRRPSVSNLTNVTGGSYSWGSIESHSAKDLTSCATTRSHEPGALGEDVARTQPFSGKS